MHYNRCVLLYSILMVSLRLCNRGEGASRTPLTVLARESPPSICVRWDSDGQDTAVIRRREAGGNWASLASVSGVAEYEDTAVVVGKTYHYEIKLNDGVTQRIGYTAAGIDAGLEETASRVILLVDDTHSGSLATELAQFESDMWGAGFQPVRLDIARSAAVADVKALIASEYDSAPETTDYVILFGHIPVPWSGNCNPDGHGRRPLPADCYYGDMDGAWTDSVTHTGIGEWDGIVHNVPGDGIFDQNESPSELELRVGRIDMYDMPEFFNAPQFAGLTDIMELERELLRQYLNKNHAYRFAAANMQQRGFVDSDTWDKNVYLERYSSAFGPENAVEGDWFGVLQNDLFPVARGGNTGGYTAAHQVGSTEDFAAKQSKVVFSLFSGSYFSQWAHTDGFLRAPLGTAEYGLAAAGGGFAWFLKEWPLYILAANATLGESTRIAQSIRHPGLPEWYTSVHQALMGDPTIRLQVVAPPAGVFLSRAVSDGPVTVNWTASPDSGIVGYDVYRGENLSGPYTKLTASPLGAPPLIDPSAPVGEVHYMVRAVQRREQLCGRFVYRSQGIFDSITGITSFSPVLSEIADQTLDKDGSTGPLAFAISGTSDLDSLTLTAVSGDCELVPPENIVLSGTGSSRTVTVTPAAGQAGTTRISLVLTDGVNAVCEAFDVNVCGIAIHEQPKSYFLFEPDTVVLGVQAVGWDGPLNYQWIVDGEDIPGAGLPTLTVDAATDFGSKEFAVRIFNSFESMVSASATVAVYDGSLTVYVSKNGSSTPPFAFPETAAREIQTAAEYRPDLPREIVVQPGEYLENVMVSGNRCLVRGSDPSDVSVVEATIVDGQANGSVFVFVSTCTEESGLWGLTIMNGYAVVGGGVNGNGSDASIRNCVVTENTSEQRGGGISGIDGLISDNYVGFNVNLGEGFASGGGGIACCPGTIRKNVIVGNTSGTRGGGLSYCIGHVRNNLIVNNSATLAGGGVYSDASGITLENNTIAHNSVTDASGSASQQGGGGVVGTSNGEIRNCIIWGNVTDVGEAQIAGPFAQISHCCIEGWTGGGTGNINLDPKFEGPDDFHPQPSSPAIDHGLSDLSWMSDAMDLDGCQRIAGTKVDIGAYEYTDTDADGIPDWWEMLYGEGVVGMLPSGDEDGDGVKNSDEYLAGTDPADASDLFTITAFSRDVSTLEMEISWNAQANRSYDIEISEDLDQGTWAPLPGAQNIFVANDGPSTFSAISVEGNYKLYRVRANDAVQSANSVGSVAVDVYPEYNMLSVNWSDIGSSDGISVQDLMDTSSLVGGLAGSVADKIMIWDQTLNDGVGGYIQLYLFDSDGTMEGGAYDGVWVENGLVSTRRFMPGSAFWLLHRGDGGKTSFSGEVPMAASSEHLLIPEWTMFGSAYSSGMDINAQTWTGATGGLSGGVADKIYIWDPTLAGGSGGYIQLYLFDSDGTMEGGAYDGLWIENGQISTRILQPGQGAWYEGRGPSTVTLTETRPYSP